MALSSALPPPLQALHPQSYQLFPSSMISASLNAQFLLSSGFCLLHWLLTSPVLHSCAPNNHTHTSEHISSWIDPKFYPVQQCSPDNDTRFWSKKTASTSNSQFTVWDEGEGGMYQSELWVSSRLESAGEMLTNMRVLALPPRESLMSIVSLWLR